LSYFSNLLSMRRMGSHHDVLAPTLEESMKAIARTLLLAAGVTLVAVAARPLIERTWFLYTLAAEQPPGALPSPLSTRRARLVDSWGNARSGGRRHEGIDIFAPRDTPVVSTTRGIVAQVGTNRLGGQVVWILGPGLERHYYAHLNRYGAFRTGDRVEAGDVIGYVGNTGNARGGPTHLHYGVYSGGSAHNPYPRLIANLPQRSSPSPVRGSQARVESSRSPQLD
jgi:murein DD-endopeptidase MepM/ murein hydrolase activator NlpD